MALVVSVCSHRGFWDGRDEASRRNDSTGPQLWRQPGGPHVHAAPRHQHQQPVETPRHTAQEVLSAGWGEALLLHTWTAVFCFCWSCLPSQEEEGGATKQASGQDGATFKTPAVVKAKASSIIMNSLITSELQLFLSGAWILFVLFLSKWSLFLLTWCLNVKPDSQPFCLRTNSRKYVQVWAAGRTDRHQLHSSQRSDRRGDEAPPPHPRVPAGESHGPDRIQGRVKPQVHLPSVLWLFESELLMFWLPVQKLQIQSLEVKEEKSSSAQSTPSNTPHSSPKQQRRYVWVRSSGSRVSNEVNTALMSSLSLWVFFRGWFSSAGSEVSVSSNSSMDSGGGDLAVVGTVERWGVFGPRLPVQSQTSDQGSDSAAGIDFHPFHARKGFKCEQKPLI